MTLSELKRSLTETDEVQFRLPSGAYVEPHYHVTEVGLVEKTFIDCGGTLRRETTASLQLWVANDYDHRLSASKLLSIIELSEEKIQLEDVPVVVEYQSDTVGLYALDFDGTDFLLKTTATDCLAKSSCGIPESKKPLKLSSLTPPAEESCCSTPGCC